MSLRTSRPTPGSVGSARGSAGVAQLVEHLFCKQVVSGSIPLASSGARRAKTQEDAQIVKASEGCPSGQREQAVNLPAHAYVGSNPTPSTTVLGPRLQNSHCVSLARRGLGGPTENGTRTRGMLPVARGFDTTLDSAGVTQLVESQFSKLKVDGSSPFSRSIFSVSRFATRSASIRKATSRTLKQTRRANSQVNEFAHLAQMVEHVLGKDEVTSSILVVGSNSVQPQ